MYRHRQRTFYIISVMFWAFPYLLWQTFGNISGFFVGLLLAVILTQMLNRLFRQSNWNAASSTGELPLQTAERQPRNQQEYRRDAAPYQSRYRAEAYREEELSSYQARECQPAYEEMQVPYPQEIPPMEQ